MTIQLSKPKFKFALFLFALLIVLVACNGEVTETDEPPDTEIAVPSEEQVVYVPAGGFYMGSVQEDVLARDDEFPQHLLRMDGFWIWQREVSNYQYAQCVAAGVCSPPVDLGEGPSMHYGEPDYQDKPVVGVSWFQAAEFCNWKDARLSTEAEWEKASRGQFGAAFPWGEDEPSCDLTNMVGCLEEPDTEEIGQFLPGESEYDALDMAGNVWEWVADWYAEDYYPTSPNANPTGPSDGEFRVVRGGSYEDGPVDLRSAARLGLLPDEEFNNVGFRCVPLGLNSPTTAPFCQDTYIPFCRPPDDDCIPTQTGEDCLERWHYNTLTNRCEPDESGCPEGSYYDTLREGCVPTTGEDCPEGWYYDTGLERCEPTDDGCPPDTNYTTLNQGCVPTTGEDCPEGWYYDTGLERCEPTGDGCPPGTYYDTLNQGCMPDGDGSDCPQGYYFDTAKETCMPTGSPGGAGQPDYELLGFGCPDGNQVTIVLYVGENPTPNYEVLVDNENFNCVVDPAYPDRLICTGPAQTPGTSANISVCPLNGSSQTAAKEQGPGIDAFTPLSVVGGDSPQLISFQPSAVAHPELAPAIQGFNGNNGTDGYCPEGYQYNEKTGQCEYPSDGDNCPDGWYLDTLTQRCKPEEDGCPPGTLYDTSQERCVPENGECPEGYYFDPQTETCEPPGNDDGGGACPRGYYYDRNIHCCASITTTTTNDCEEGYYYQYETDRCLPTDDYGCGPNLTYNPYEGGCVPNQYDDGDCGPNAYYDTMLQSCVNEDDGCPEGYELGTDGYSCMPSNQTLSRPSNQTPGQTGPECREPGSVMNELGYCVPDGGNGGEQNDCGPNGYFDTMLERCITPGDGDGDEDCGPGYYYNTAQEICRPTDGPGSPCGQGFAYHTGLDCCEPTPGNDSTFCPDPQFAGLPSPGANGATSAFMGYSAPSNSDYDYGRGYCDPGDDYECPPGYHSDTQDGSCVPIDQGGECPDGYHSDTPDGSCAPITLAALTTSTLVSLNLSHAQQTQTDCPPGYYYDTYNNGCVRQEFETYTDDCGEGAYYDYELNFCVPTTCDDCAIGYYYDTQLESCVPYDGNGTNGNGDDYHCPLGYYYDTAQETCMPISTDSQGCWTLTTFVPVCPDKPGEDRERRCPQGYRLNKQDECVPVDRGEEDTGGGSTCTNPGQYTDELLCVAAGCTWSIPGSGGGTCQ